MTQPFIHPLADVQTEVIGSGTTIWQFVVILAGAKIGMRVNICSHCFIESDVSIGDDTTIKSGVCIWNGVSIANNVFIGPHVTFTNDRYPKSKNKTFVLEPITIEAGAVVGAGSVLLPGISIGADSIIGAGSVVVRDVLPGSKVYGSPAHTA